jgi:hypothetical protein
MIELDYDILSRIVAHKDEIDKQLKLIATSYPRQQTFEPVKVRSDSDVHTQITNWDQPKINIRMWCRSKLPDGQFTTRTPTIQGCLLTQQHFHMICNALPTLKRVTEKLIQHQIDAIKHEKAENELEAQQLKDVTADGVSKVSIEQKWSRNENPDYDVSEVVNKPTQMGCFASRDVCGADEKLIDGVASEFAYKDDLVMDDSEYDGYKPPPAKKVKMY